MGYPIGFITELSHGNGQTHAPSISTDDEHSHGINYDGAHTHTDTVARLPPFYALCFIMKL